MSHPVLQFWYEFASTYSYLSAMRIETLAQERGVDVVWRPFLLGPIFAKAGWHTSPFSLYPAKGRYMWRDIERLARAQGLPFARPDPFPQNGLLAARVAGVLAGSGGSVAAFSREVYLAQFGDGQRIDDEAVLARILRECGAEPEKVLAEARTEKAKSRTRSSVDEAQALGIFGAPSFTCADGELFWGNDRLESAVDHALATVVS